MLQSAKLITEEQMHGLHDYVQSIYVLGIKNVYLTMHLFVADCTRRSSRPHEYK